MKIVVTPNNKDTVHVKDVSRNKYYGVITPQNNKGFITRLNYNSGPYISLCCNDITCGNYFYNVNSESLSIHINNIICNGNTVYEFDTNEELFKWLAS
jgi:hypothetical protein